MELSITGPVFDASGYAEAARSIIFGLLQKGYTLRVLPKDWSQLEAGLPPHQKKELLNICGSDFLPNGPILQICIAQDFQPIKGRVNIGMTMLECDRLPDHWVEKCNQMDQVWVPSSFNEQTFTTSGVDPTKIRVVPIGVNVIRFHPEVKQMTVRDHSKRFVFLSNFEWVRRKGYDLLLQAYLEEFTASDPVLLVIKTYDGSDYDPSGLKMHQAWNELIKRMEVKHPPALNFLTAGIGYDDIPAFYASGDIYIIPTRGEGWNLPALEAMASGIPVITTDWSAHLDFVNRENSFLIEVEKLELIPTLGIPNDRIYHQSHWAVPSLSDIRRWMRYAFEHPEEVAQKGKLSREQVIDKWSTEKMIERISQFVGSMEA